MRDPQWVPEGRCITLCLRTRLNKVDAVSYSFPRKMYPETRWEVGFSLDQYPSTQGKPDAVGSWVLRIRCSP